MSELFKKASNSFETTMPEQKNYSSNIIDIQLLTIFDQKIGKKLSTKPRVGIT